MIDYSNFSYLFYMYRARPQYTMQPFRLMSTHPTFREMNSDAAYLKDSNVLGTPIIQCLYDKFPDLS